MDGVDINQVRQQVMALTQQEGADPNLIIQIGQFARQVIANKSLYPIFKQAVLNAGLADPGDLGDGVDYKALSYFVAAAKILQGAA